MQPRTCIATKAVGLLALATVLATTSATPVNIINQCGESIELWDNSAITVMTPGQVVSRNLPVGFHGMFRAGMNPQATLAEFAVEGGMLWYDISIIPTGPKSGPEYCPSLQACKDLTGGVGYNIPMQIAPKGCKTRTCTYDGCPDAYQYPKDDTKTTSCTMNTEVDLTFCPGGPGGQTQAPATQAPTPPPTTQAPTPPPTTQAPTPPPTTQAPTPKPTTQAPTPEPTTQAPTPEPTTQAPTPEPTTQAPTPEPTTQAPTPEPTVDLELLLRDRSMDSTSGSSSISSSNSSSSDSSSFESSSFESANVTTSSSNDSDSLEAGMIGFESTSAPESSEVTASVELNPVRGSNNDATSTGGSSQNVSVQGAKESNNGVGMTVFAILCGVACVAGTVVFVAMKKKKELEETETKDSPSPFVAGEPEGLLTPLDDIQCI